MRIAIDLQACQTPDSRHRGIGRYSLSHIKAFLEVASAHEVILLLNNRYSDSIIPVRQEFADLVAPENIRVFEGFSQLGEQRSTVWKHKIAESIYQDFVAGLKPDLFHITSLFERIGDVVTSHLHVPDVINSVTLYDLIPWQYRDTYLTCPDVEAWYYRKLQTLKNSDLLLSISNSSRNEAIELLGVPSESIVNISSAIGDHFVQRKLTKHRTAELRARYDLKENYILYTGGIDFRKNIEGLIEAYSLLPLSQRDKHQLVVVCKVDEANSYRLHQLAKSHGLRSGELVLTGFVPEEDLVDLYNLAHLFVFPSIHEGFGLPALEAMACGTPTLVSNRSSLPEVVGRADMQFDPSKAENITKAISGALSNPAFLEELSHHGLQQCQNFSWRATAEKTLEAFEDSHERHISEGSLSLNIPTEQDYLNRDAVHSCVLPTLAYFSPVPPSESGIADYSKEVLVELAKYYNIDLVSPQTEVSDPWLRSNFPCRSLEWFSENSHRFDRVMYHFGNSHFHTHMFEMLESFPGTVVLHDFFLSNVLNLMQPMGKEPGTFDRALYRSHGYPALIEKHRQGYDYARTQYPSNLDVISQAQGVIVHSKHSQELAQKYYSLGEDWSVLPLPRTRKKLPSAQQAKRELGLPENAQVIASFGFLYETKLNHELFEAWAKIKERHPQAYLVYVGRNPYDDYGNALQKRIAEFNGRVRITGFVTAQDYDKWLAATDLAVQLRRNSRGETSAAVLDCIVAGKTLVYNEHGSAKELPDGIGYRLSEQCTVDELSRAIDQLLSDNTQAQAFAEAAAKYGVKHSPGQVARAYAEAIERFSHHHPVARQSRLLENIRRNESFAALTQDQCYEIACVVSQNANIGTMPICYLDLSDSIDNLDDKEKQAVTELLSTPPVGMRVELLAQSEQQIYIACAKSCELLGIPPFPNQPLLTGQNDIWIHIDKITAPDSYHAKLLRSGMLPREQLVNLSSAEIQSWLKGNDVSLIENVI